MSEKPLLDCIVDAASENVKLDHPLVKIISYVYFSRWTDNPLNLFLKGESSIGKTYVTRQTVEVLGEDEDVWWLGGLSPASLVHEHGQLYCGDVPLDTSLAPNRQRIKLENPDWNAGQVEKEYQRQKLMWEEKLRNSHYLVDLTGKLLIFLESPSVETYDRLRPLLSHDKHGISFKFVDKTGKGQLRTVHVKLHGWPATIFLTSNEKYMADLSTRSLTATPNLEEAKIKAALDVTAEKYMFPQKNSVKNELRERIEKVKGRLKACMGSLDVLVPYADQLKNYVQLYAHRVMRDFDHFLQLIKVNALINMESHDVTVTTTDRKYILANLDDLYSVFDAWKAVEATTVTGASGSALKVFRDLIQPSGPVTNYHVLVERSRVIYPQPLSSATIRRYVSVLQDVGLVDLEPDPEDKRRKVIRVIGEERKMLKSVISDFPAFFKLETLKGWWKKLLEKCANNPLLNITVASDVGSVTLNSTSSLSQNENETLSLAYQKLCVISEGVFLHIFLKPQIKPENEKENREKPENLKSHKITQFSSLVLLDGKLFPSEKCNLCGTQPIYAQETLPDGSWVLLCENCYRKRLKEMEGEDSG